MKQCEATTLSSSYSQAHRCLKMRPVQKKAKLHLCAHHESMDARKQP